MAITTVADVAAATKMTFTAGSAEKAQCEFYINMVDSYVSSTIGCLFAETTRTDRLQADYDGVIRIPYRPVSEVSLIETIEGDTRTGWEFDGIVEVDHLEAHEVVDVTYTAGYSSVPSDLKYLATCIVARMMYNPEGIRQQTVGAISETWASTETYPSGQLYLSKLEQELLDRYCETYGTLSLGPRDTSWRHTLPIL